VHHGVWFSSIPPPWPKVWIYWRFNESAGSDFRHESADAPVSQKLIAVSTYQRNGMVQILIQIKTALRTAPHIPSLLENALATNQSVQYYR
jgi:hypothetical protein